MGMVADKLGETPRVPAHQTWSQGSWAPGPSYAAGSSCVLCALGVHKKGPPGPGTPVGFHAVCDRFLPLLVDDNSPLFIGMEP